LKKEQRQIGHTMKGINTPGQPWTQEALPPFPPQGTGYLTLLSRHSLQRGTFLLIPFLSLRWGIKTLSQLLQGSMTTMVNLEDECNGTVVQSRLLGYFAHYKKICLLQSELQQQLSIHRSTIANMLKGMERDGLILRKGTEEAGGPERDSNDSMP
jgi:hypothetical protein